MELFVIDMTERTACVCSAEKVSVDACNDFLLKYLSGCSIIFDDVETSVDDDMYYFCLICRCSFDRASTA